METVYNVYIPSKLCNEVKGKKDESKFNYTNPRGASHSLREEVVFKNQTPPPLLPG